MGAALLAKPPKRVWGKSRNVTDNSPTRLGALRAALSYPKHDGVSWVWLTIVILVKVKCTLRGHILAALVTLLNEATGWCGASDDQRQDF